MFDPLNERLAALPIGRPDPERAERIRRRCRARLTRQARRAALTSASPAVSRIAGVWKPLVASLGVFYLVAVIGQALQVIAAR